MKPTKQTFLQQLLNSVGRGGTRLSRGGEDGGSRSRLPVFPLKWADRSRSGKMHEGEAASPSSK